MQTFEMIKVVPNVPVLLYMSVYAHTGAVERRSVSRRGDHISLQWGQLYRPVDQRHACRSGASDYIYIVW